MNDIAKGKVATIAFIFRDKNRVIVNPPSAKIWLAWDVHTALPVGDQLDLAVLGGGKWGVNFDTDEVTNGGVVYGHVRTEGLAQTIAENFAFRVTTNAATP